MRKIIHIDMDCFYAAIEMRDFPELLNQPVAVGGDAQRRGVISTCNYEARAYGVRSAMATAKALQRCPHLILQPARMAVYRDVSETIRRIFFKYTELVEPLSLDEAYLDVTDCKALKNSATFIAQAIREEIYEKTRCTASAGIAPNKSLAKIASDWHKPNGQKVICPADVASFVQQLPVRKLFGVGPQTEKKFQQLGIVTCQELQLMTQEHLVAHFGRFGFRLYELSRGIDNRPVNPERKRLSISVEETYPSDLKTSEEVQQAMPALFDRLMKRIEKREEAVMVQSVFVKLKCYDFSQTTVEKRTLPFKRSSFEQLLLTAWSRKQCPVRLIGVGVRVKEKQEKQPVHQLTLPGL